MFPFGCAGMPAFLTDNQFLSDVCHWHPTSLSHHLPSFLAALETGLRTSHMRGKCSRAELPPSSSFLHWIIINSGYCFILQLGMLLRIHIWKAGSLYPCVFLWARFLNLLWWFWCAGALLSCTGLCGDFGSLATRSWKHWHSPLCVRLSGCPHVMVTITTATCLRKQTIRTFWFCKSVRRDKIKMKGINNGVYFLLEMLQIFPCKDKVEKISC